MKGYDVFTPAIESDCDRLRKHLVPLLSVRPPMRLPNVSVGKAEVPLLFVCHSPALFHIVTRVAHLISTSSPASMSGEMISVRSEIERLEADLKALMSFQFLDGHFPLARLLLSFSEYVG